MLRTPGLRPALVGMSLQALLWFAFLAIPLGEGTAIGAGEVMLCAAQWTAFSLLFVGPVAATWNFIDNGGRFTRSMLVAVFVAFLGFGLLLVELRAMWPLERRWYAQMGVRAQPVIDAMGAYQAQHGEPPPDLEALVPEFLPAVPGTGMRGFPKFRYLRKMDGKTNPLGLVEDDWELYVPCGCFVGFDQIFYWPGGNYPTGHTRGGYIERIGDWAYVHE